MPERTMVLGVIGADVHAVGNQILNYAFTQAGFHVVNLGVMVSQQEFIEAAIESAAGAIVVSSLYGHGELDCRGLRDRCDEAGLKDILLYVGGNIVVGKQPFEAVRKRFEEMGFDRVFGPGTPPETTIQALRADFEEREAHLAAGEADMDDRADLPGGTRPVGRTRPVGGTGLTLGSG